MWGIDISNHQAGANLAAAKASGCSFVYIKATEGLTYTDPYYSSFRTKAKSAGLPSGGYHFAHPQSGRTGTDEARKFLSVHKQSPGDLPPVLDLEDTKLSPAATAGFALEWLTTVEHATHVTPIVYTGSWFWIPKVYPSSSFARYPLWISAYQSTLPSIPKPWSKYSIWQNTSSAKVAGIPGNCDHNVVATGFNLLGEEDMALTLDDARTLLTGSAIMKNVFATNPDTAPRVAASFLIESSAETSKDNEARLKALAAKVDALSAKVDTLSKAGVSQAELEAALRNVFRSIPS